MPLNYAYAWTRSQVIRQQLRRKGLTGPAENLPIIYIPGIIGSKLYDVKARVNIWGDPLPLLRPQPHHAPFALDERALTAWQDRETPTQARRITATETLHAFAIVPGLVETLVTQELAYVLENALGYKKGRDLFFLGYDWRQDCRLLSLELDALLRRIRSVFGENIKVALIGQSVASQAIRFWLQHTREENLAAIARWYSFGPSLRGTFNAVSMLHTGYYPASPRFKGFTPADIASCPSCYQLLRTAPQIITDKGETVPDFSFYDPACWQEYRLGPWHENLKDALSPEALKRYLQLGLDFNRELERNTARLRNISQAWFLGDHNQAVYAAVAQREKLLLRAKEIKSAAPQLIDQALTRGDDHLPLQDFIDQPNGAFVRNDRHIPYGENYMFVGQPKDHRALINYGPNLKTLAFDLAVIRKEYNL